MVFLSLMGARQEAIHFGEREPTHQMMKEQLAMCLVILFPLAVGLGQLTARVSCQPPRKFFSIRSDIWNAAIRILVADILTELVIPSVQCIPLPDEETLSEWMLQSWGFGCPLYAKPLAPMGACILFTMRLLTLALGIYLGEAFCPIVLTGSIATGKSTVVKILLDENVNDETTEQEEITEAEADKGGNSTTAASTTTSNDGTVMEWGTVYMVDSDSIAHEIILKDSRGSVYKEVVGEFGTDILNDETKEIDRSKLGEIVFPDPAKRRRLNRITHPRILNVILQKVIYGLYFSGKDLTIVDVPLLYETRSWILRFMFVVSAVVSCAGPGQQEERLRKRNPDLTEEQCRERISSQISIHKKEQWADLVVRNDGSLSDLEPRVEELREELCSRIHGVGIYVFQMVLVLGAVIPVTVWYKLTTMNQQQ